MQKIFLNEYTYLLLRCAAVQPPRWIYAFQLEYAERERETGTTNGTFRQRLFPTHHEPEPRNAALCCPAPDGTTLD